MKVKACMTPSPVSVTADSSVATAARVMARNHVGALPVRGPGGKLCGMVTDRDLILRCVASGEDPASVPVGRVMTTRLVTASPEEDLVTVSQRMAKQQLRRLPVVENGNLVGMVSLADLSRQQDFAMEAAEALTEITRNVKKW